MQPGAAPEAPKTAPSTDSEKKPEIQAEVGSTLEKFLDSILGIDEKSSTIGRGLALVSEWVLAWTIGDRWGNWVHKKIEPIWQKIGHAFGGLGEVMPKQIKKEGAKAIKAARKVMKPTPKPRALPKAKPFQTSNPKAVEVVEDTETYGVADYDDLSPDGGRSRVFYPKGPLSQKEPVHIIWAAVGNGGGSHNFGVFTRSTGAAAHVKKLWEKGINAVLVEPERVKSWHGYKQEGAFDESARRLGIRLKQLQGHDTAIKNHQHHLIGFSGGYNFIQSGAKFSKGSNIASLGYLDANYDGPQEYVTDFEGKVFMATINRSSTRKNAPIIEQKRKEKNLPVVYINDTNRAHGQVGGDYMETAIDNAIGLDISTEPLPAPSGRG